MKTKTWLPGFNGFYGSLWDDETGEETELGIINDKRREKNLAPVTWDDCEWDYKGYYLELSKDIVSTVKQYLVDNGFVEGIEFEKLVSPHEYNFQNDSIDVEINLSKANQRLISDYLRKNLGAFNEYIKYHYTSHDGFFSSYSNDVNVWLIDDYLTHAHKLGAVLDFILNHHLKTEENVDSVDMWLYESCEVGPIYATNYQELIEGKEVLQ